MKKRREKERKQEHTDAPTHAQKINNSLGKKHRKKKKKVQALYDNLKKKRKKK